MPDNHAAFVGSIPENYDRYLGPVLFEPYAADLVQRLEVPADGSLLELACGTGIVTRRLRDRLPPSVKMVATDLNEAMIDYARQKFRADENIEWKPADATDLPFDSIVRRNRLSVRIDVRARQSQGRQRSLPSAETGRHVPLERVGRDRAK